MTKPTNNKVAKVAKTNLPATTITTAEVPNQIAILQAKLDELLGDKDETVSTDILFRGSENVKSVTTLTRLLEISAAIHAREEAFQKEKERYDVKNVASWEQDGKSLEQWKKIIAKAIKEFMNKKQIELLKNSINKLENYLDETTKLDRDVKAIMASASEAIK